tara:strand:+ start:1615 stop:2475 length:861 start_codon:yes stop_codon:yes gene_type:complete
MKKISYLFYRILMLFDRLLNLLTRRSFLIWFSDFVNDQFYSSKEICNKKTIFFTPNQIIKWRVDTLYTKEPETLEWIDKFNQDREIIFWDIGANIGLYSIYAAQKHKNIKVTSFEPSTSNLRVLSRNISINNLNEKITINQIPLNDKKNSNLEMYESEFTEGWSMNTFGQPTDYQGRSFKSKQKYKIFGTTIDFLLDNKIVEMPNYIKIDVDGIEHQILKGGLKYLNHKNIKSLSIELNEKYTEQFDHVIKIMKDNNFIIKQKKHAEIYDEDEKFSCLFNYIFEKR